MTPSVAAKAGWASLIFGVGNLAVLDFVLVPEFLAGERASSADASPARPVLPVAPAKSVSATSQVSPSLPTRVNTPRTRIVRSDSSAGRERAPDVASRRWTVLFSFNRADLSNRAKRTLRRVVDSYDLGPGTIEIAGHTDTAGDAAYNARLSQARATAVAQWLAAHGVPEDGISISAFGEERPQTDRPKGRASRGDRRVEIVLEVP